MAKDKYINDQAATTDDFGTHANIATTLLDTIADEDNKPMTIGLEGSWGSGKSTVVNLMFEGIKNGFIESKTAEENSDSQKNETWKNIEYFYIDVWQHEHSCIKRAILHEMIKTLKKKEIYKGLDPIEKELHGTTTKTFVTPFSIILAFAVVVIPLIAAILNNADLNNLTWEFTGSFEINLIVSIVLLVASIGVLFKCTPKLLNITDRFKNKDNKKEFLLVEQTTTTFENSSIEFSRHFNDILEVVNGQNSKKKTLIVFDNLDRIDEKKAKEMWAELQVFMQYRNPGATEEEKEERPWIIIPYDLDGIRKIWGEEDEKKAYSKEELNKRLELLINDRESNPIKSFLDKTFSFRVHVPKQITSYWNFYLDKFSCNSPASIPSIEYHITLKEAEDNEDYFSDDKIFKTIKKVIEFKDLQSISKPIKPREINDILNTVIFYRNLICKIKNHSISIESLCFFAYHYSRNGHLTQEDKLNVAYISDQQILKNNFPVYKEIDYNLNLDAIDYQLDLTSTIEITMVDLIPNYKNSGNRSICLDKLSDLENQFSNLFWKRIHSFLTYGNDFNTYICYSNILMFFHSKYNAFHNDIYQCLCLLNDLFIKQNISTIAFNKSGKNYLKLIHQYNIADNNTDFLNKVLNAYKKWILETWHNKSNSLVDFNIYLEIFSIAKMLDKDFVININYKNYNMLIGAIIVQKIILRNFFNLEENNFYPQNEKTIDQIGKVRLTDLVLVILFTNEYNKEFLQKISEEILKILKYAVKNAEYESFAHLLISIWESFKIFSQAKIPNDTPLTNLFRKVLLHQITWKYIDFCNNILEMEEFKIIPDILDADSSNISESIKKSDLNRAILNRIKIGKQ